MYDHVIRKIFVSMAACAALMIVHGLSAEELIDSEPRSQSIYRDELKDRNFLISDSCDYNCSNYKIAYNQFVFNLDLLYWRAIEDGLDGCGLMDAEINAFNEEDESTVLISKRNIEDPHFNWNTGFRLGIGWISSSCWDVVGYWTCFNTDAHLNQKRRGENEGSEDQRSHERRKWNLNFNAADVVFSRNFHLNQYCLNLRPFLGLRGAWINQKLHSNAVSAIKTGEEVDDLKVHEKNKERFQGIGPLLGFQADWYIGCNFSLFGAIDFGVLYGHFNVRSKKTSKFEEDSSSSDSKKNIHACEAVVDAVLGLSWNYRVCNCFSLILQLSCEHHRYFDQNKIGDNGDLCFDGGTFSANIAF